MEEMNVGGVKVEMTASQQFIAASKNEKTITLKSGRTVVMRRPSRLDQLEFKKCLSGAWDQKTSQMNPLYASALMPCEFIGKIDESVIPCPTDEAECKALYARFDDDEWEEIMSAFVDFTSTKGTELKNSQRT